MGGNVHKVKGPGGEGEAAGPMTDDREEERISGFFGIGYPKVGKCKAGRQRDGVGGRRSRKSQKNQQLPEEEMS